MAKKKQQSQPAPRVFEQRPQKTTEAAVRAAARHVKNVHASARRKGQ
jgi:hypothetical protein